MTYTGIDGKTVLTLAFKYRSLVESLGGNREAEDYASRTLRNMEDRYDGDLLRDVKSGMMQFRVNFAAVKVELKQAASALKTASPQDLAEAGELLDRVEFRLTECYNMCAAVHKLETTLFDFVALGGDLDALLDLDGSMDAEDALELQLIQSLDPTFLVKVPDFFEVADALAIAG